MDMEAILLVMLTALYGGSMKVADLLDEHGLRLFRGDAVFFGVLWGASGVWLVLASPSLCSTILAMNVAFIVRNRLDYWNHQIAATMIIATAVGFGSIDRTIFLGFLAVFVVFGGLKDYVDDVLHAGGFLARINEMMWYYLIPTFIYSWVTGDASVFAVFALYWFTYNTVKLAAEVCGYR